MPNYASGTRRTVRRSTRRPTRKYSRSSASYVTKAPSVRSNRVNSNFSMHPFCFSRLSAKDPFQPGQAFDFTYAEKVTLGNGAVGTFGTESVWRLNSLYDPNFTGTGHQPYGYDQCAVVYNRYKVHAATVELIFTNPTDDMFVSAMVNSPNDTVGLTSTLPGQAMERPNVELQTLANAGTRMTRITRRFNLANVIGCSQSQFDADIQDYTGLIGANPAKVVFLRIAMADPSGVYSENAIGVNVLVRITFHSHMWDRITQAQS